MKKEKWMARYTKDLSGKTAAITGATGGLGIAACRDLLELGADLILVTRDRDKTEQLTRQLLQEFPRGHITWVPAELTDLSSVKSAVERLQVLKPDFLILNAGAYSIPRATCTTGLDNVFQINFASHYYMARELLPVLAEKKGKILAMGSIAHSYSRSDGNDVDFAGRSSCELVYGNSKRYLMFGLTELMRRHPEVSFAIAHPGITFTNITAHYPKYLFMVIKWPMKVTFMKPAHAVRSLIRSAFEEVPLLSWVGPRIFGIWGDPVIRPLRSCDESERSAVFTRAEAIYQKMKQM